jgi:activator of 2-hydroxyglutaryl-CoA dehydratase
MVKALEDRLGMKVKVPNDCELCLRLGAASSTETLEARADN